MKNLLPAALVAITSTFAEAQSRNCGITELIERHLTETYGESNILTGIFSDTVMDRVFLNPETGSYTLLRTDISKGFSCIIGTGQHGVLHKLPAPGEDM